jgi:TPR repeat protein
VAALQCFNRERERIIKEQNQPPPPKRIVKKQNQSIAPLNQGVYEDALQGDADAQNFLGFMYADGDGVPEDNVQAYAWWSLAAAQGHENASMAKDIIRKEMTSTQITEAEELSRELCAKIPRCAK